jgi:hypothetical protein
MATRKDNPGSFDIGKELGELKGVQQSMNQSLTLLHGELTAMRADVQAKHEENHKVMASHKADDATSFSTLNKLVYGVIVVSLSLWAVVTFFVSTFYKQG